MTTVRAPAPTAGPAASRAERRPEWAAHVWLGLCFTDWLRLLVRNRFAVHPACWHVAAIGGVVGAAHSLLAGVQHLLYGRRIARTEVHQAPVFILGHWRAGTTLLHELLIRDPRHGFPTTYECFEPNHFLLTEWLAPRLLFFLLPGRRPMDNMSFGWDRPQEDEFALCLMGQPSPYETIAFPNRPPAFPEYFDLEAIAPEALARWKRAFRGFIQRLTYKDPRRLVLKSPPHGCRIKVLLELFPDARFVHIVRNPYAVFPSTIKLWKTLYRTQGLQRPRYAGLEEYVYRTFLHLHERLEEGRKRVPPGRFHELRYEDLVADPLGQLQTLYRQLELGDFEPARPGVQAYLAATTNYETNRHELKPEVRDEITRLWGEVIRRYGYPLEAPARG